MFALVRTDPRAARLLRDYVKRYEGATVGSGANKVAVDIAQVREAQARLAALPAARAKAGEVSASEAALQASLRGARRSVEEEPGGLGLSQVYGSFGGAWTSAGQTDAGAEGYAGLGPRLGAGRAGSRPGVTGTGSGGGCSLVGWCSGVTRRPTRGAAGVFLGRVVLRGDHATDEGLVRGAPWSGGAPG